MTAETYNTVHPAGPEDLHEIVAMIHEHAAYEKEGSLPSDHAIRLAPRHFGSPPSRLRCFVGVSHAGALVGYSTVAAELSTWQADEFLSMDCLFIRDHARGHGLGQFFMTVIKEESSFRGISISIIHWQTPDWNRDAVRFCDRLRATRAVKQRYTHSQLANLPTRALEVPRGHELNRNAQAGSLGAFPRRSAPAKPRRPAVEADAHRAIRVSCDTQKLPRHTPLENHSNGWFCCNFDWRRLRTEFATVANEMRIGTVPTSEPAISKTTPKATLAMQRTIMTHDEIVAALLFFIGNGCTQMRSPKPECHQVPLLRRRFAMRDY